MTNSTHEFHTEEYKQLRTEVTGLLLRIETLFRYSLVIVATVSAWLLSHSMGSTSDHQLCVKIPNAMLVLGWLIPPAFIVCAGLMAAATNTRVNQIGIYLETLENHLGEETLGWQKFLGRQASIITLTTKRAWWALFIFSLLATATALLSIHATRFC
ncbi:MAG: hypothetical protein RR619_04580 [Raoultibacter sp.]